MVNKQKRKGDTWEREFAKLLTKSLTGSVFKRVPGSGALGTIMGESRLTGDVVGTVPFCPKKFKFEAKTGYGGHTQLTIKRDWLEKIREEADAAFAIPGLVCKFDNARSGVKQFVVLDMDAFIEILELGNKLHYAVESLTEEMYKLEEDR